MRAPTRSRLSRSPVICSIDPRVRQHSRVQRRLATSTPPDDLMARSTSASSRANASSGLFRARAWISPTMCPTGQPPRRPDRPERVPACEPPADPAGRSPERCRRGQVWPWWLHGRQSRLGRRRNSGSKRPPTGDRVDLTAAVRVSSRRGTPQLQSHFARHEPDLSTSGGVALVLSRIVFAVETAGSRERGRHHSCSLIHHLE